jgi:hypothetical protein
MLLLALPFSAFISSTSASVSVACKKKIWGTLYYVARVWPLELSELNEIPFASDPWLDDRLELCSVIIQCPRHTCDFQICQ